MKDPTRRSLADLEAALAESEAQAARGDTVPLDPMLARLRASIERMETLERDEPLPGRKM